MSQNTPSNTKKSTRHTLLGDIPMIAQYTGAAVSALLVWLLLSGGATLNQPIPSGKPAAAPASAPASVPAEKPKAAVALAAMNLTASNAQNHFTISGSVPSEAIKMSIDNELRATFGDGHYTNNLTVNDQIKPAKWLDHLKGFFGFFKLPGAELTANGDILTLSGTAISLKNNLIEFVGDGTTVKALDIASNVKTANSNALSAMDNLSANSDAQAILNAMNMQIINFASGSSQIPAENQAILKKAAVLLKDKKVAFEVSGHADNVGNEANNLKLSEQRAKAVRDFLIKQEVPAEWISAKGYGSSVPVASNDTETGRLKNRRIEYRLTK